MPPREQGTGDPHLDMGLDPEKGVKESQNYDPESSELQHSEANPSEERQRMISVDMVYVARPHLANIYQLANVILKL